MHLTERLISFQQELEPKLDVVLNKIEQDTIPLTQNERILSLISQLREVSKNGKRVRPFLTEEVYRLHTDELEDISQVLVAIELFHLFCLVHDDVMDEASIRHGAETIHKFGTSLYGNRQAQEKISDNQAILVGDLLFNAVYTEFTEFILGKANTTELLRHFSTMVHEVCIGQMIDVDLQGDLTPSNETLVKKNTLKTAYYSIIRPMQLGALIAQKPEALPALEKIGFEIGLMYQLQDDLLDIGLEKNKTGKNLYADITQSQPTILTNYIQNNAPELFEDLEPFFGKMIAEEDYSRLYSLFSESGAIDYAELQIATHLEAAENIIKAFESEPEKEFFTELLDFLHKRKK